MPVQIAFETDNGSDIARLTALLVEEPRVRPAILGNFDPSLSITLEIFEFALGVGLKRI